MQNDSNNNNNGLSQDVRILLKGVELKKNKSGGDHFAFKLDAENTDALIEVLTTSKTQRGARLDFHVSEREGSRGVFLSGILFAKGIQEPQPSFGAQRPGMAQPQRYGTGQQQASQTAMQSTVRSKIEGLKRNT